MLRQVPLVGREVVEVVVVEALHRLLRRTYIVRLEHPIDFIVEPYSKSRLAKHTFGFQASPMVWYSLT